MPEVLSITSQLLESPGRLLTADDMDGIEPGARDFLLRRNILVPARPASSVTCDACHDDHVEDVTRIRDSGGATLYRISCPEAGWVDVPKERLKQWAVDANQVAAVLADSLQHGSQPIVVAEGVAWRLGEISVGGAPFNLVLGLDGAIQPIIESMPVARTIVLFPIKVPADGQRGFAATLPMHEAFSLDGEEFRIESNRILTALREDAETAESRTAAPDTGFQLPPTITHKVTYSTEFLPTPAADDPKGLRDAAEYCRAQAAKLGDARAKWWWAQAKIYDDSASEAESKVAPAASQSNPTFSDEPLSERAQLVLIAMVEEGAVDSDHRRSTEDIAKLALGGGADANALKGVMSELKTREYVESKTGRGGGCWLTDKGRVRGEKLRDQ